MEIQNSGMGRAIIILDMHRSGTSALMRVVNLCSIDLGSNLMPPILDNNEKSFWESREVYQLNEHILEELNSSFLNAGVLGVIDQTEAFLNRIVDAAMFRLPEMGNLTSTATADLVETVEVEMIERILIEKVDGNWIGMRPNTETENIRRKF
jgi:hypothetical protein